MRVHFLRVQCINCPLNVNGRCEYKEDIKKTLKEVLPGTHVSYKCKKYKTLFKKGDKVLIDLYSYRRNYDFVNGEEGYKWECYRETEGAMGIITGDISGHFLYRIKLIKPAKLYRVDFAGENVVLEDIAYQLKPANKITLVRNKVMKEYFQSLNKIEHIDIRIFEN
jgi:hypothetical protein